MQEAVEAGLLCWLYYVCRRDYHDLWSKARFFFSVFPCFPAVFSAFSSPHFEPTGKQGCFSQRGLSGFRFGNKGRAIVRIWEQRIYYIIRFL
jgi:hypothetical protein